MGRVTAQDGLVSHYPDTGMYVPPELAMFVELFRKKVADWEIAEEADVFPLGTSNGKNPVSAFNKSATRSGPACVALEPDRKNQPRSCPPLDSVSSAAARRFSTRNSDIQPGIGRKAGRLDILMRHGIHTD